MTRPSVATFENIVRDPAASNNRAYAWVFVSALLSYAIAVPLQWVFTNLLGAGSPDSGSDLGSSLVLLVCGAPLVGVFSVLGLMISAAVSQFVAGILGGSGTYTQLAYALAAYLAPLALITGIVGAIPLVNCLLVPLGIYGLVLNIVAVKAVHQFGWGKAVASSVVVFAGILVVVAFLTIIVLALLGPAIGNVFSNIIEGLDTPAP
jgi:hypothetical protein